MKKVLPRLWLAMASKSIVSAKLNPCGAAAEEIRANGGVAHALPISSGKRLELPVISYWRKRVVLIFLLIMRGLLATTYFFGWRRMTGMPSDHQPLLAVSID